MIVGADLHANPVLGKPTYEELGNFPNCEVPTPSPAREARPELRNLHHSLHLKPLWGAAGQTRQASHSLLGRTPSLITLENLTLLLFLLRMAPCFHSIE